MDSSIRRRSSNLSSLIWDPVSGSCVVNTALRQPPANDSSSTTTDAKDTSPPSSSSSSTELTVSTSTVDATSTSSSASTTLASNTAETTLSALATSAKSRRPLIRSVSSSDARTRFSSLSSSSPKSFTTAENRSSTLQTSSQNKVQLDFSVNKAVLTFGQKLPVPKSQTKGQARGRSLSLQPTSRVARVYNSLDASDLKRKGSCPGEQRPQVSVQALVRRLSDCGSTDGLVKRSGDPLLENARLQREKAKAGCVNNLINRFSGGGDNKNGNSNDNSTTNISNDLTIRDCDISNSADSFEQGEIDKEKLLKIDKTSKGTDVKKRPCIPSVSLDTASEAHQKETKPTDTSKSSPENTERSKSSFTTAYITDTESIALSLKPINDKTLPVSSSSSPSSSSSTPDTLVRRWAKDIDFKGFFSSPKDTFSFPRAADRQRSHSVTTVEQNLPSFPLEKDKEDKDRSSSVIATQRKLPIPPAFCNKENKFASFAHKSSGEKNNPANDGKFLCSPNEIGEKKVDDPTLDTSENTVSSTDTSNDKPVAAKHTDKQNQFSSSNESADNNHIATRFPDQTVTDDPTPQAGSSSVASYSSKARITLRRSASVDYVTNNRFKLADAVAKEPAQKPAPIIRSESFTKANEKKKPWLVDKFNQENMDLALDQTEIERLLAKSAELRKQKQKQQTENQSETVVKGSSSFKDDNDTAKSIPNIRPAIVPRLQLFHSSSSLRRSQSDATSNVSSSPSEPQHTPVPKLRLSGSKGSQGSLADRIRAQNRVTSGLQSQNSDTASVDSLSTGSDNVMTDDEDDSKNGAEFQNKQSPSVTPKDSKSPSSQSGDDSKEKRFGKSGNASRSHNETSLSQTYPQSPENVSKRVESKSRESVAKESSLQWQSQAERIAKYKEERRKKLAYISSALGVQLSSTDSARDDAACKPPLGATFHERSRSRDRSKSTEIVTSEVSRGRDRFRSADVATSERTYSKDRSWSKDSLENTEQKQSDQTLNSSDEYEKYSFMYQLDRERVGDQMRKINSPQHSREGSLNRKIRRLSIGSDGDDSIKSCRQIRASIRSSKEKLEQVLGEKRNSKLALDTDANLSPTSPSCAMSGGDSPKTPETSPPSSSESRSVGDSMQSCSEQEICIALKRSKSLPPQNCTDKSTDADTKPLEPLAKALTSKAHREDSTIVKTNLQPEERKHETPALDGKDKYQTKEETIDASPRCVMECKTKQESARTTPRKASTSTISNHQNKNKEDSTSGVKDKDTLSSHKNVLSPRHLVKAKENTKRTSHSIDISNVRGSSFNKADRAQLKSPRKEKQAAQQNITSHSSSLKVKLNTLAKDHDMGHVHEKLSSDKTQKGDHTHSKILASIVQDNRKTHRISSEPPTSQSKPSEEAPKTMQSRSYLPSRSKSTSSPRSSSQTQSSKHSSGSFAFGSSLSPRSPKSTGSWTDSLRSSCQSSSPRKEVHRKLPKLPNKVTQLDDIKAAKGSNLASTKHKTTDQSQFKPGSVSDEKSNSKADTTSETNATSKVVSSSFGLSRKKSPRSELSSKMSSSPKDLSAHKQDTSKTSLHSQSLTRKETESKTRLNSKDSVDPGSDEDDTKPLPGNFEDKESSVGFSRTTPSKAFKLSKGTAIGAIDKSSLADSIKLAKEKAKTKPRRGSHVESTQKPGVVKRSSISEGMSAHTCKTRNERLKSLKIEEQEALAKFRKIITHTKHGATDMINGTDQTPKMMKDGQCHDASTQNTHDVRDAKTYPNRDSDENKRSLVEDIKCGANKIQGVTKTKKLLPFLDAVDSTTRSESKIMTDVTLSSHSKSHVSPENANDSEEIVNKSYPESSSTTVIVQAIDHCLAEPVQILPSKDNVGSNEEDTPLMLHECQEATSTSLDPSQESVEPCIETTSDNVDESHVKHSPSSVPSETLEPQKKPKQLPSIKGNEHSYSFGEIPKHKLAKSSLSKHFHISNLLNQEQKHTPVNDFSSDKIKTETKTVSTNMSNAKATMGHDQVEPFSKKAELVEKHELKVDKNTIFPKTDNTDRIKIQNEKILSAKTKKDKGKKIPIQDKIGLIKSSIDNKTSAQTEINTSSNKYDRKETISSHDGEDNMQNDSKIVSPKPESGVILQKGVDSYTSGVKSSNDEHTLMKIEEKIVSKESSCAHDQDVQIQNNTSFTIHETDEKDMRSSEKDIVPLETKVSVENIFHAEKDVEIFKTAHSQGTVSRSVKDTLSTKTKNVNAKNLHQKDTLPTQQIDSGKTKENIVKDKILWNSNCVVDKNLQAQNETEMTKPVKAEEDMKASKYEQNKDRSQPVQDTEKWMDTVLSSSKHEQSSLTAESIENLDSIFDENIRFLKEDARASRSMAPVKKIKGLKSKKSGPPGDKREPKTSATTESKVENTPEPTKAVLSQSESAQKSERVKDVNSSLEQAKESPVTAFTSDLPNCISWVGAVNNATCDIINKFGIFLTRKKGSSEKGVSNRSLSRKVTFSDLILDHHILESNEPAKDSDEKGHLSSDHIETDLFVGSTDLIKQQNVQLDSVFNVCSYRCRKEDFEKQKIKNSVEKQKYAKSTVNKKDEKEEEEEEREGKRVKEEEELRDMEPRRRRRLLERTNDVSSEESTSWRTKVYQDSGSSERDSVRSTDSPNRSSRTFEGIGKDAFLEHKDYTGRRRSEDGTSDLGVRLARRRSEDSGDLAERLARRRAQRLEEHGSSQEKEEPFDSPRLTERRRSRDESAKSQDSLDGDLDERIAARRARRRQENAEHSSSDSPLISKRDGRRGSLDSLGDEGRGSSISSSYRISSLADSGISESVEENGGTTLSHREKRMSFSSDGRDSCFVSAESYRSFDADVVEFGTSPSNKIENSYRNGHLDSHHDGSNVISFGAHSDGSLNGNINHSVYSPRRRYSQDVIKEEEEVDSINTNNNSNENRRNSRVNGVHQNDTSDISDKGTETSSTFIGKSASMDETRSSRTSERQTLIEMGSASLDTGLAANGDRKSVVAIRRGSLQDRLRKMRGDDEEEEDEFFESSSTITTTTETTTATTTHGVHSLDTIEEKQDIVSKIKREESEDFFATPPSSSRASDSEDAITRAKRRKARKDKSAARKSALNARGDSDVSDDEAPPPVGGESRHDDTRTRRKPESSFVSQHASLWESNRVQSSSAQQRPRTNIPSRYMGDLAAKINATRQKFNQASTADSSSTATSKTKSEHGEEAAPKRVRGRTDFSQLLQKFSGSEASASEKSDTDAGGAGTVSGVPRRRNLVTRQEAKEILTSSEDSEGARRTPERTQSLKLASRFGDGNRSSESPSKTGVGKSSSFRSEFMSRRMAQRDGSSSENSSPREGTPSKSVSNAASSTLKSSVNGSSIKASETSVKAHSSNLGTLDKSLELLSRVTDELEQPDKPSSLPVSPLHNSERTRKESLDSISKAEDFIKHVESNIAARLSPDKTKLPPGQHTDSTSSSLSRSRFEYPSEHNARPSKERSPISDAKPAESSSTEAKHYQYTSSSAAPSLSIPASISLPSLSSVSGPVDSQTSSDISSTTATSTASTHHYLQQQHSDLASSSVRRTASVKDVSKSDTLERRKGILKRTTSLKTDGPTAPIIDPQLAKILQQRRQIQGDVEEEKDDEVMDDELDEKMASQYKRRSRALSAAEEIEETLKYSQQRALEKGLDPEEDVGLKRCSVAERVFSMQTKIEEVRFKSSSTLSPRSRSSGTSTPKSSRSGPLTPIHQKSMDESLLQRSPQPLSPRGPPSSSVFSASVQSASASNKAEPQSAESLNPPLSGAALMERLTKIADSTEAYQERRQKFQGRPRNDWRHLTQPVTLEEIQAADSLETVSALRALIRKQTVVNAFDQITAQTQAHAPLLATAGTHHGTTAIQKSKEPFPQHIAPPTKHQIRGRRLRHRTLPVTAEELKAVPENQVMVIESKDGGGSRVDSGVSLSSTSATDTANGQDQELLRNLALEMDLWENDPARMSVSAKASMFKTLEEKTKADREREREKEKEKSASGARRYINRKKRERSQTMPITEDEVKSASELETSATPSGGQQIRIGVQPEVVNRPRSQSLVPGPDDGEQKESDDELLKLSLSEKVRLFSQLKEEDKPKPKVEAPVKRRRNRKHTSRFSTQPVTSEEVEKAANFSRISPLAMSMVKPPDPELLMTLPLKDQREMVAAHAEAVLSQASSRSQSRSGSITSLSQPSSRRASVTGEEIEGESEKRGILKDKSASTKDLGDPKSILKTEPTKAVSEPEVHSILKAPGDHLLQDQNHLQTTSSLAAGSASSVGSSDSGVGAPKGILKKTKSEDIPQHGILKHTDSEDDDYGKGSPRSRSNSQPHGILKHEQLSQLSEISSAAASADIKSILKATSQENVGGGESGVGAVMKSALRRGSHDSDSSTSGPLKSAMRSRQRSEGDEDSTLSEATPRQEERSEDKVKREAGDAGSGDVRASHIASEAAGGRPLFSLDSGMTHSTSDPDSLRVAEDKAGPSASESESSSGELLEDTPRHRRRRNRFSDRNRTHERYKTQPTELPSAETPVGDQGVKKKFKYEGRHKTQPITPNEMKEAEATATPNSNLTRTPGGSIADRLSQLKTSGEEEWRKRVKKEDSTPMPEAVVKLRDKPGLAAQRPTSIADRLSELEVSKQTWKVRVEDTDVKQFTVAGKLQTAAPVIDSPLINKLKQLPKKEEPGSKGNTPISSPVTPTKEFINKIPLPKDIVADPTVVVEDTKWKTRKPGTRIGIDADEEEEKEPVRVAVPEIGEEVEAFFATKSIEEIKDTVELEVDDFDNIFIEAEMILPTVRKVRASRKKKATSANPLKTMSQTLEVQQEYLEISRGTAEKEFKRLKKEKLSKEAGFAQEALAGLASKENFKSVELRRSDSGSTIHGQHLDPFKDVMLLHIKGRRYVQTRLVEPHTRSLNSGDCFILVTPEKIILWEGQFANVIEKAKASDLASFILQKRDLGCKKATEVNTVYQNKDHLGAGKLFYQILEGEKQCQACGPDQEDELFESSVTKTNMIYRLEGNALKPYTDYWGCVPKYEMLKKNEVYIFDYGTEFYIWQGKQVTMEQRKLGLRLAKQLFEKGYDYSETINPYSPLRTEEDGGLPVKATVRPKWAIFGKINQNMETILFREKFSDWPDNSRLIGVKRQESMSDNSKELQELKPFDAALMLTPNTVPVTLKLEGENVGRGLRWTEDMQGFIKQKDIITRHVAVWHVNEYDHYKLEEKSQGQFHDGDTYVVRWQYMMANANLRSLKGSAARNSLTGRERCAYFFWQGNNSTINEKGASALMTVELDEERGPQVRVLEGKEPPCFLNLFEGKMVLHIGKREDPATNTQGAWRLYCLRGDIDTEVYLLEIPVLIEHLRSRSSLVLVNVKTGLVYIWHGAKSPKHVRELARKAVDRLAENRPLEMGFHEKATVIVTEMDEGEEKKELWVALDGKDRTVYNSLLTDPHPYRHTIRLFQMSSVNMVFEVNEQLNPARTPDLITPFPFYQADLYKATQPALFLLDNEHVLYLWLGWWPIGSHDQENVHTGSATARFNADRRCAMETALNYCKAKKLSNPPKVYLVFAGVEPKCFTTLFPYWQVDTLVRTIALEEGKEDGYMEDVSDVLHRLTKTRYTLAELQERPLPEGVDPLKLEAYLHDEEFEDILDMNREEFYAQPLWKQKQMKQHVGLF